MQLLLHMSNNLFAVDLVLRDQYLCVVHRKDVRPSDRNISMANFLRYLLFIEGWRGWGEGVNLLTSLDTQGGKGMRGGKGTEVIYYYWNSKQIDVDQEHGQELP
jgi:hypothetical protein